MGVHSLNKSQLLYRITNLQYSIHRKQHEYNDALKTNNSVRIDTKKKALAALKTELDTLMLAFNTIPTDQAEILPDKPKKISYWLRFFRRGRNQT